TLRDKLPFTWPLGHEPQPIHAIAVIKTVDFDRSITLKKSSRQQHVDEWISFGWPLKRNLACSPLFNLRSHLDSTTASWRIKHQTTQQKQEPHDRIKWTSTDIKSPGIAFPGTSGEPLCTIKYRRPLYCIQGMEYRKCLFLLVFAWQFC